jgi:hypothetical protein
MTATINPIPEVRKIGRSYFICANKSTLSRYRSEAQAVAELANNRAFYEYWAGSVGVSIENTEPVTILA